MSQHSFGSAATLLPHFLASSTPIWVSSSGLKTPSLSASFVEVRSGTGSPSCLHVCARVRDRCSIKLLPIIVGLPSAPEGAEFLPLHVYRQKAAGRFWGGDYMRRFFFFFLLTVSHASHSADRVHERWSSSEWCFRAGR